MPPLGDHDRGEAGAAPGDPGASPATAARCRLAPAELERRARAVEWIVLDVDGVLTTGLVSYLSQGGEMLTFDIQDGHGIKLAQRAGIRVAVLSGRGSGALRTRAEDLELDAVMIGRHDKGPAFAELCARYDMDPAHVAAAGDDLQDLPLLLACGLSFAPADAVPEVREAVDCVLSRAGGRRAVRELVEMLLKARGAWEGIVASFRR
ncbi:MAG TPA: HAD hydrolase family protein [Thermoanaerobaculia bacterium]|nr:HAD hydrolase family protein [Thermoanaerobaculia bacterium]